MEHNPILNSPFRAPERHWILNEDGSMSGVMREGRRVSQYYVPIAPSTARQAQGDLALDEADREGRAFRPNALVNRIREHVARWRREGSRHVTHETARLLAHWRSGRTTPPLFFCQIEAAETMIWLAEAAPHGVAGREIIAELAKLGEGAEPALFRIAAKMATGSGKTTVMAMLIAWHTINAARGRKRFSDAFLIVCPGVTIRDRLRVLLPSDPDNYYQTRGMVPDDMIGDIRKARVAIVNYHAFKRRETLSLPKYAREVIDGRAPTGIETLETEAQMVLRVCKDLGARQNIVVLNDEAHHCYDAKAGRSEEEASPDDAEERGRNKEAARLWINGIRAIARARGVRVVHDLSATPFFLRGSGHAEGTLFPWVVSDFSLIDAIESGIVKIPRVPVSDNALGREMPVWRRLWPEIREGLPKKGARKAAVFTPDQLPEKLLSALHGLYGHYARLFPGWMARFAEVGRDTPPVFIVVCQNTSHSKLLFDYIAGYQRTETLPDGATREVWVNGALPLFANVEDGRPLSRPRTLLIDSAEIDSGESLSPEFKKLVAPEIESFRAEVAARQGQGAAIRLTEEDLLREVMNTVGAPGKLGEQVRCVVSVSMLTEGWDANTVTHILGVRAFGTELLCEQVVGRALRRVSYDPGADGLFQPEYASVFGIPFTFAQTGPEAGPPAPPKPTRRVHAERARAEADPALEIRFPRVLGYRVKLPSDRLRWTWSADSRFTLSPDRAPTRAEVRDILGAGETITLDTFMDQRPATVAFHIAGHALRSRFRDEGGALKPYLFPQLLRAARDWLETQLTCTGGAKPGLFLWKGLADEAAVRIHNACVAAEGEAEPTVLPIIAPYNPEGSSAHVDMLTAKTLLWATNPARCHVNLVVGDSDWEVTFCETLESMPEVRAYVKNHGLGFEVPYAAPGGERRYRPDFILRIDDGAGDLLNLVVEIKGFRDGDDALKAAAMRGQWLPAVNNDGRFGRWAFVEVRDVYTGADDIRRAIGAGQLEF